MNPGPRGAHSSELNVESGIPRKPLFSFLYPKFEDDQILGNENISCG